MEKKQLAPLQVDVGRVKPLIFGQEYESRMILDHVITGRDDVIQINHGTVKADLPIDQIDNLEQLFHEKTQN